MHNSIVYVSMCVIYKACLYLCILKRKLENFQIL